MAREASLLVGEGDLAIGRPLTIQIVGKAVAVAVVARVVEAIASLTDAGDRYLRRDPRQEAGRGLSRRAVAIVRQARRRIGFVAGRSSSIG